MTSAVGSGNLVVKRTFLEVASEPHDSQRGRAASDFARYSTGKPYVQGREAQAKDDADFELTGMSDADTNPDLLSVVAEANLPCYTFLPDELTPASASAEGASAEPASEATQTLAKLMADNARLSMENDLLRENTRLASENATLKASSAQAQEAPCPPSPAHAGAGAGAEAPYPGQGTWGVYSMPMQAAGFYISPSYEATGLYPASYVYQPVSPSCEERTTVMLRNLPNNYTRAMVQALLDKEGFAAKYDFLYLPIDFKTGACLGYAFVNLVSSRLVARFWQTFDGYSRWVIPSKKICGVTWSGPHQGLEAHVDRYRNSPVMHASVPEAYRPLVFQNGRRMPFPAPTKEPRAPRTRSDIIQSKR